ncbi:ribosome small subunit-dependent GTPase A [Maridesulfovibrio sp.]|uniref:ribosome small subunit-dependent GTPase A n=1 Tax=Maridesulfovibrio sp. TaxID=2795000 RepID=UPI002A18A026|nr:ribosome small subunit-dependent GTPase A [Maridesulfovibrio sp.]
MTDNINSHEKNIKGNREQLRQLGWNSYFENMLAGMDAKQNRLARVISVQRNLFLVADGQDEWLCSPAGRITHSKAGDYPITGDWVLTEDIVVTGIIPRRNMLSRGESGTRGSRSGSSVRGQAIAANLDTVFIVCGLDRDFNIRRLERYLTLVYNCGLTPVIVLTKADLHEDPEQFRPEAENIAFGVPVVLTSMHDAAGVEELDRYLENGQTVAMIGSSGAGKSTLANRLYGNDIQATGAISTSVGKGRHTTTARELIRMPQGGMLMDNPGIREIAFHDDGSGIESTFADIQDLAAMCRFADCSHSNEPGCAVLEAVENGQLTAERLASYQKMKREMEYISERRDKSADRVEKERWKGVSMRIKSMMKHR